MAVDDLDECGIYFGTTGGQVFASPDGGDTWSAIAETLPSVLSVEVQTLQYEGRNMIRVILPQPLRQIANTGPRGASSTCSGAVTQRSVLDALEAAYPVLKGTIRDHVTKQRRPLMRFFACKKDLSLHRPIRRCPSRWRRARSRSGSLARLPADSCVAACLRAESWHADTQPFMRGRGRLRAGYPLRSA